LNPLVQNFVGGLLRIGAAPPAVTSCYDDLIAFWSSTGSQVPDIKFIMQPFTLSNMGDGPVDGKSGFQIVCQLIRPASRGTITSGSVDPNYFANPKDQGALQKAVEKVRELASQAPLSTLIEGNGPYAELFESSGINGGGLSLGSAVDPSTFLVQGADNIYVCDGSLIPKPLLGSLLPMKLAVADKMADRYMNKLDIKAKMAPGNASTENVTRIIYS
jgi:choline dehydrogenase